jgi:DnaJ-class molecular chaperone
MRRHHPDLRPGDAHAEHRAREANAAWYVLGNSARRAAYDRQRSASPGRRTGSFEAKSILWRRQVGIGQTAYSSEGASYRRAFTLACLRLGSLVFAVGAVLLLAFSNG